MTRSQRKRKAKQGRDDLRRLERLLYAESTGRMVAGRCAGCDRKIASYVPLTPQEMQKRDISLICECGFKNKFFPPCDRCARPEVCWTLHPPRLIERWRVIRATVRCPFFAALALLLQVTFFRGRCGN